MRKANDFEMMDQITIYYHAPTAFENAVKMHADYIMSETLATELVALVNNEAHLESHQLNGHEVGVFVQRNA